MKRFFWFLLGLVFRDQCCAPAETEFKDDGSEWTSVCVRYGGHLGKHRTSCDKYF